MSSSQFNTVLLQISNQLSADQLASLIFLCNKIIMKKDRETIKSGIQLFQFLTERGKLGPEKTEYLSEFLKTIQRPDLADKLDNCDSESGITDNQPPEAERAKLDIATQVIAENVGRNWRKLGRKLGLNEVKLESISRRHPTDLEETVMELIKEWKKMRGAEAQTKELIDALRACQFNLTADKVEDRLNDH